MKRLFTHTGYFICLFVTTLTLSGCWSLFEGPGPGYYNYQLTNIEEVMDQISYNTENAPFYLSPSSLQAPMLSDSEGIVLSGDFGKTKSFSLAAPLGKRFGMMLTIGRSDFSSSSSEQVYAEYDYTYTTSTGTTGGHDSSILDYRRENEQESRYFELAFGRHQELKKGFRNEWWLGGSYGKTENLNHLESENPIFESAVTDISNYNDIRQHFGIFIQDDFGIVTKHFEASAILRFNSVFFTSRETELLKEEVDPDYARQVYSFEPGVRLGFGGKIMRLYAQYDMILPIHETGVDWYGPVVKFGILCRFRN